MHTLQNPEVNEDTKNRVSNEEPIFDFERIPKVDKNLAREMWEVIHKHANKEAYPTIL